MNQRIRLARFKQPFERLRAYRLARLADITQGATVTVDGEPQRNRVRASRRHPLTSSIKVG